MYSNVRLDVLQIEEILHMIDKRGGNVPPAVEELKDKLTEVISELKEEELYTHYRQVAVRHYNV